MKTPSGIPLTIVTSVVDREKALVRIRVLQSASGPPGNVCGDLLDEVQGSARVAYVYIYSHDHDSAYEAADRMVLARVPKGQIRNRGAYEFLRGLDNRSEPIWTKAIKQRGAVFVHKDKCYRSGISYNPALKRYLWSQTLPGQDARFRGGFGIYDAPNPWGPWTTVFHTETWDVGPGDTSSFPTKWVSGDGKTLFLVFSGDDHFSVQKGTITLREPRR